MRRTDSLKFLVTAGAAAGLAVLAWLAVADADERAAIQDDEQLFAQLTYEVTSKVEEAFVALRGLQGLFAATGEVSRSGFHQYARALGIGGAGGSIQAVQFARWLPHGERAAFEAQVRADTSVEPGGYPQFRILPPGERPFYVATEFNEPMQGNEGAFGFDTAFGPVRAAVMESSRDSGLPMASAPFTLIQTGKTGIVLRAPIYAQGTAPADVGQRLQAYRGQVSVVVVADALLGRAIGNHLTQGTEITLTDVGAAAGPVPGSADVLLGRYGRLREQSTWRQQRFLSHVVAVHGRLWKLDLRSRPVHPLLQAKPLIAGGLVLTLALLVGGIVRRATGERDSARARASAVLAATRTGIIAIDATGTIRSANPAACRLFGHEEGKLLGQPVALLGPGMQAQFSGAGPAAAVGTVREIGAVTCAGEPLDLAMSLGEIGSGDERQWLASFHDISLEKRIQEQERGFARELTATVQSRTAELTRVNHELEAFAYSVAHDLRAPVRHVHGFARVLELRHSDGLDDKGRHYVQRIVAASHDMGRLIDDLLAFSQINHGDVQRAPVDLAAIVQHCVRSLAPELEGRTIEWRIGPLPVVQGDAGLLTQVMSNLLGNAVKYSAGRDPAVIEVFSESLEPGVDRICVRDNGVGFDMQHAHRLFKVFSRLHHKDEFEGTGVGLANVRRIVERHGGRVWVEGEAGRGAAFWFSLGHGSVTV